MLIRPALESDAEGIWRVLRPTLVAAETFALPADMSREEALAYWSAPPHEVSASAQEVFVAEERGVILGTYYIRPNQLGGGAHVANCGYMVAPAATGRGIAQSMGEHSFEHARSRGFLAVQFNFVVSSNERAVRLWEHAGFKRVGLLPKAFRHPALGLVDVFVMHRFL